MPAPQSVLDLVSRFESQRAAYLSGRYNETELRRDFLDPFFEALGWDVRNTNNASERYRDVIHEKSVEIAEQAKSADYLFQVGGDAVFFVEAKKPSVNIETSPAPAFQLRSYAWSAKLPFSILTDFEQLAFYECTSKPLYGALPSLGRIALYNYRDYPSKWEEISARISRTAVTSGAFENFVKSVKGKRGTTDVDDAFLAEMERWRLDLARNIALRNPSLSQREINFTVQTTIDRIIFLRICEDRGIEPEEGLRNATDGIDVYGDMLELFRHADKKYNSGLFHFDSEKGRVSSPDKLSPTVRIDDKVLKDILSNLYYPKSPYAFKYFSADILGQVYERFLGKVITLSAGHRADVQEKPEVRKAGGVYYTPTYIVNYIVKNTVGELLKDRAPDSFKSNPLRVLDPACGSGSFLLGAYQFLMDWYLDWYVNHDPARYAKGSNPAVIETLGGWQLTLEKKKSILLDHIFGVDIDSQAVEVTKLSLLLKVVENPGQLSLYEERILPDLGENIKCGNSLIGPDFYDAQQGSLFDSEEHYRVNAFDWHTSFPQVFKNGGFDAVIGNPPYIRIQALKEWAPLEVEFYKQKYKAAGKGNYDIYLVFVEKGLSLINQKGKLGFILPHKFFNAQYGEPLRQIISKGNHLKKIVHFGANQVFEGATTYTCLLFLQKTPLSSFVFEKVTDLPKWEKGELAPSAIVESNSLSEKNWTFSADDDIELLNKFDQMPVKLEHISKRIFQGFKTGADPVFILDQLGDGQFFSHAINSVINIEKDLLQPLYKSGEMKRYCLKTNSRFIIFPYENSMLIPWDRIEKYTPKTAAYLKACKSLLVKRENGKWSGANWYCFTRNQALEIMASPKILTADLNPYANYCFDETGQVSFPGGAAGGYGIVLDKSMYFYILGLLNSKAVDYFHKKISTNFRGGWFGYDAKVIQHIPIHIIDRSNPSEVAQHDRLVALVETMLTLHKQLAASRLPDEQVRLQRRIAATDCQIDQLVYQLYDLTPEEIAIVEAA